MRFLKIVLVVSVLLGCLLTYLYLIPRRSEQGRIRTYRNPEAGFLIDVPTGWKAIKAKSTDFFVLNGEDVSISITAWPKSFPSLDVFFDSTSVNKYFDSARKLTEIERGESTIGGLPAKWRIYTLQTKRAPVQVKEFYIVEGTRAFSILFSAPPDKFTSVSPLLDRVVETFRTDPNATAQDATDPCK